MIQSVCSRAIFLLAGEIIADDDVNAAMNAYESWMRAQQIQGISNKQSFLQEEQFSPDIEIKEIKISQSNSRDSIQHSFEYSRGLEIQVYFFATRAIHKPDLYVKIINKDGSTCCMVRTSDFGYTLRDIIGFGMLRLVINPLQLTPGSYLLDIELLEDKNFAVLAQRYSNWFEVVGSNVGHEGFFVPVVDCAEVKLFSE